MITTTTFNYEPVLSKKDILKRIYDAGHISFDELWTLILGDQPQITYNPSVYPYVGNIDPYYNTYDNDNQTIHNS